MSGNTLHFYPGQKLLVLFKNGKEVMRSEAWGGPATVIRHPGAMEERPTTPGNYIIHGEEAYFTPTWPWSSIRWGTPLKDKGSDVHYMVNAKTKVWASLLKDKNITRLKVMEYHRDLYGTLRVPDTWVFNDFGPIAVRYFKDLNGNRRLDKGREVLSGEMLHTTPDNEAQYKQGTSIVMGTSHGCVHMKPPERDLLRSAGAFTPGNSFVVHGYAETYP